VGDAAANDEAIPQQVEIAKLTANHHEKNQSDLFTKIRTQ